jgi:hypothetical protein
MRSSRTRSCAGSRRPPTDAWRRRPGAWGRQARGPRGSDHGTCCAGACIDAPAQCLLAGRVGACRTHGAAARSHGTPAGRPIGIKRRVSRRGRPSRRADRAACRARALPCLQSGGRVTVVRGGGRGVGACWRTSCSQRGPDGRHVGIAHGASRRRGRGGGSAPQRARRARCLMCRSGCCMAVVQAGRGGGRACAEDRADAWAARRPMRRPRASPSLSAAGMIR